MIFFVFRCSKDPEVFVVTDETHASAISASLCPDGGEVEKVGEFPELGSLRVAFQEAAAKKAINEQGYYRFRAKSFSPAGTPPDAMPG